MIRPRALSGSWVALQDDAILRFMAIELRPIRADDLAAVHALLRRIEVHDRVPFATPREDLDHWLEEPHFDLATDGRVVEDGGAIVAWGRIWHHPSGVRQERAHVFGGVAPDRRGRGIGTALLAWQIAHATALLERCSAELPRFVRAQAYDFEESAIRLYERAGLAWARNGDEMLRDLADLAAVPSVPGVTIVSWDPARADDARVAQNDAFADHWGSTPHDLESWRHFLVSPGVRLDLSRLALEAGRIVGVCINGHFPGDEAVSGRREGWILNVSVPRSHRGRGIATALIADSLVEFARCGMTHSSLGVDTDNPTGAYRLYERLGYRRIFRKQVFQKSV
jgi:mycothiol synthase